LANRVFLSCEAWCVYDITKSGYEAFIWRSWSKCWKPATTGLCINGKPSHRVKMTDYIENTLCESTTPEPTDLPTLWPTDYMPIYEWTEERAEELCPSTMDYFAASKSYEVQVCDDANSVTKQASLEVSLANKFYQKCSSWCVYDFDTLVNNIQTSSLNYGGFMWKDTCYKWVTGFQCFSTHFNQAIEVFVRAQDLCILK